MVIDGMNEKLKKVLEERARSKKPSTRENLITKREGTIPYTTSDDQSEQNIVLYRHDMQRQPKDRKEFREEGRKRR